MKERVEISNVEVLGNGDTVTVEVQYPRCHPVKFVEVGLCDVRSADGLRLSFDFDRNGWKVEQARYFSWETDDAVCDPGWVEVAFIDAWGSKVTRSDE